MNKEIIFPSHGVNCATWHVPASGSATSLTRGLGRNREELPISAGHDVEGARRACPPSQLFVIL